MLLDRRVGSRRATITGFSLVELLVVIGIIGILIGLLLPALARAREQARCLKCQANLHGLGEGLFNYAAALHGQYPAWSDWQVYGGDGTGEDTPGPGWTEELEPYYAKVLSGVYGCPSFPPETQINYFISVKWQGLQGRRNLKQSDIKLSSEYVLGGECTHQRLYPPPWGQAQLYLHTNDCDKDDNTWKCLSWFGEPYGFTAHHAGNNVLFGDGHVEAKKSFDPQTMTYNPQKPHQDWGGVTAP